MSEQKLEMQKPIETVDVTISLPKAVLEFLQQHKKELDCPSVEKYCEDAILRRIQMDAENDVFKFEILETIAAVLGDEA